MRIFVALVALFFGFCIYLFADEIIWNLDSNKDTRYTIEITYLNGKTDTIVTKRPHNTHYQVNCHSHKGNFNGCNLEYVKDNFPYGHWASELDGVNSFRILKKEKLK